jgi:predicted glycoside hydrolase/deacetylase ChbG (UPF0249 family)
MMTSSLLQRLGFTRSDRVVVLHVDDVGMCEATLAAFRDVAFRPTVSAASTMVPCPWFPALAQWCREHAARADVGVHLTLNSEWSDYRWSPILGAAVPSLQDELGYFHRWPDGLHSHARREDVRRELGAQIVRARAAGVDVTHLDSHIFTLRHPALLETYVALAREHRVPAAMVRRPDPEIERSTFPREAIDRYYGQLEEAEAAGLALFDAWVDLPLSEAPERRLETGKRVLDGLPAGLSALLFHPAVDSRELRAIAPDWAARVADYDLLMSDRWAQVLETAGIRVLGMRAVRDALADLESAPKDLRPAGRRAE